MTNIFLKILVLIVLIFFASIFVFPIIFVFTNSFMSEFEILGRTTHHITPSNIMHASENIHFVRTTFIPDQLTFNQYITIFFRQLEFMSAFWNSVFLAIPIVIGQVFFSSMAAYAFEISAFKHKEKIFVAYIIFMLLPLQVALVPNFIVAGWLGISQSRLAVILPAMFNPFGVFLMRQFLRGLPKDYIDAAEVDGASHLRIIWAVIVPMFKPALAALVILTFIDAWNIVEQAIVFLPDELLPLSVQLAGMAHSQLDIIFAASFFYLIPPVLMFMFWKEHMIEGISLAGIK